MPRFSFVFLWVFLLFLLAIPAFAQVNAPKPDIYTVQGVEVDIKGNAAKARDSAFTEGGKKAFDMLAAKLAGEGKISAAKMDDASISRLIKSFEVEKEKASSGRYIATLTFHFRPGAVQSLFASRGISINEDGNADVRTADGKPLPDQSAIKPAEMVLVLPVLRIVDHPILWEEQTSWQRAWANYLSDSGAADLVIGDGNAEDVRAFNSNDALMGNRAALMRIMQIYHAKAALVPVLESSSVVPASTNELTIQVTRYDFAGVPVGSFTVPLHADKNARVTEWLQGGAASVINMMRNMPAMNNAVATMGGAPGSVAGQMPGMQQTTDITITVPFAREEDWSNASSSVESITGVTRFDPTSINHDRAIVKISFNGPRQALDQTLRDHGYQLVSPRGGGMDILLPLGKTYQAQPMNGMPPGMVPVQEPQIIYAPVPGQIAPQLQPQTMGPNTDAPGASQSEDNSQ